MELGRKRRIAKVAAGVLLVLAIVAALIVGHEV
jgi:hypothetical protein